MFGTILIWASNFKILAGNNSGRISRATDCYDHSIVGSRYPPEATSSGALRTYLRVVMVAGGAGNVSGSSTFVNLEVDMDNLVSDMFLINHFPQGTWSLL